MNKPPKFATIRQTARQIDFPEHRLRVMVSQGLCPGIRSGNRFLINVDALIELLDRESWEGVSVDETGSQPPR